MGCQRQIPRIDFVWARQRVASDSHEAGPQRTSVARDWSGDFFTRSSLCAAAHPAHDQSIGTSRTELVMEWWVLAFAFALAAATYGLYRVVDRLRSAP